MTVLWVESGYTMKWCLSLSPLEIPQAQAIFHRIPLLSSQYSYNIITLLIKTYWLILGPSIQWCHSHKLAKCFWLPQQFLYINTHTNTIFIITVKGSLNTSQLIWNEPSNGWCHSSCGITPIKMLCWMEEKTAASVGTDRYYKVKTLK